jgi:hypothetical protein
MPKVSFHFNLPEEKEEFETTSKAFEYKSALREIDDYLRRILKYDCQRLEQELKVFEEVREKFFQILDDEDVGDIF